MQPGFRGIVAVSLSLLLAGVLAAQTRGYARLASHEAEIVEGCTGLVSPAPRTVSLAVGQPIPLPVPLTCGTASLRVTRFRLTLPARTEPGVLSGDRFSPDTPLTIAYDLAAEWTGGTAASLGAEVSVPGGERCADAVNANLNAQGSRVCEWTAVAAGSDGFAVTSRFNFAAGGGGGPVWSVRSTARYAWTAAPTIERIEVVQAVQNEEQHVPLFSGKPTQVRVFPAGSIGIAAKAQLQVKYAGGEWRHTTPRTVVTPAQINRNTDSRSFVIPLPAEVVAGPGTISIDAQLLTAEGRLLAPLGKPATAEFVEAPRAAPLAYLHICESSADGRDRVCPDPAAGSPQVLGAMAEQVLPVATLPQSLLGTAVVPAGPDALRRLMRLRLWLDELPTLVAVLPSRGELAVRVAGRSSAGLRLALASDAENGAGQLANSLAGVYGVPVSFEGTGAGFDLRSGSVVPAGSPSWVSAATVEALASRLRARAVPPATAGGAAESLSVSGTVARDGSAGTLGFGFRSSSTVPVAASDAAARTCLQLASASGETSRTCFPVERLDEAAEDAFAVRIPWLPGTRQLTLLHGDAELATRTISGSPPQATLLTPQIGNRLPEGPMLVQWSGSDADGDGLRYDLAISTDGGSTWLPIACELDRTDFTFDTSLFPTSSRVMVQLRYSDGLQSGSVTTGPFEIIGAGGQLQAPASAAIPAMLAGQPADALVTIANTGSGTLTIDTAAVSNAGAVQLVSPAFPAQVAPGSSLPLRLRVTPPAMGALSATLTLDGVSTAARIALNGRGVNARTAQLEQTPGSLDFGTVMLGQSRDLPLTIGNGGAAPLTVTAAQLSAAFHVTGLDEPVILAPGGQQEVRVSFQPAAVGSAFEQLLLGSDDPLRRSVPVPLSGYAVAAVVANDPRIEVRPAPSADFGNVRMGTPAQQTFTVRNSGRAPLVITQVFATPADYSVRDFPALPFTLAPNAERLFFVRIDAIATGARLGQLQINSNDPAAPVLRIGLSAIASLPVTGTVVLSIDDGTFERYAGFASGDSYFLSRLKPPAYPATLKAIRIYFGEKSLDAGEAFGLLWAAHPTGTEELPVSLRMQSASATVRNPVEFIEYPVTPVTIESGDVLVGFQTNKPMAAPLDISTNLMPTRSYASKDGGTWRQSVLWPGFPSGVFAIRAVVELGPKP
jgi:hypothetical protein